MNALKVIIYFSIFKYPLTKEEIFSFSSVESIQDISKELKGLLDKNIIFKFDDYYSDVNDKELVSRRLKGNKMANDALPKAIKVAKLIMKFPYIESVSISGALSKGYHDIKSDIDFFIITKSKRLWLARTLLVLYKKIVLFNSRKYFCVNYFISTSHYEIAEKNTFTAIELLTLIPVFGQNTFNAFIKSNAWANTLFPRKDLNISLLKEDLKKPIWSKTIEMLFNNNIGNLLDRFLKKITLNMWKSKFKHLNKNDFEVAMKSTNDVSKHHPKNFQSKVILALNEKYAIKNEAFNLNLTMENA